MTHFEEELKHLKQEVNIMFALVHTQLSKAKDALIRMDKDLAREILNTERRVNAQELNIDRDCENYFALFNPVAVDLRYLLAVLKINNNLERTGDIAEGIAKFLLENQQDFDQDLLTSSKLLKMFDECINMMEEIEMAFENEDTAKARSIFKQDEILDAINREANKSIAEYIRQHPENVEQALYVLSTIRKLERVGDQAKNIAEEIIFYVEAKVLKHSKKL
ncbi:MAG: phosphate transport system regulatory protein PhoU [Bacteroidetes bacterium B1(2017)]|nr:MAG: phosphate transport system regulatory protein PhoU [Bacteroidetes bacterium B1(2017)]